MKICSYCKQEKELSEYSKDKNSKDGKTYRCKACFSNSNKKIYEKNKEKIQQRTRQYAIRNKDKVRLWQQKWYKRNKNRCLDKSHIWYANNKGKAYESSKQWASKNKDKTREIKRNWKKRNPEKVRKEQKNRVKNLSNGYIASLIYRNNNIERKDIPHGMIELYKLNIILKRLKKEKLLC